MMLKRKQYLVLLAVLFLSGAFAFIFWPQTKNLKSLVVSATRYDVRILRDAWGVPHIFGATDADAVYGLAYAHAEDDFLTIQQVLAAARGQLASLYGAKAAPNDYMVHLLRIWDVVNANYEKLHSETRALVEAYADGLNHYAALHSRDALPGLFPVTGKDVIAGSVHKSPLFFGLEKALAKLFEKERPSLRAEAKGPREEISFGSNTFAVSPKRSAHGETFLAVNSHQPWTGPVAWYEAHVHSEQGWDAFGAIFPGAPCIIHGHNRRLGWAFTVNKPDLIDIYLLQINPNNPMQYRFDGKWLDWEVREAPIKVKLLGRLSWTVKREVLWSVYGPVIRQEHGANAVRYAGFGEVGIFEQLFRLNKARDFTEWKAAMQLGQLPMFNAGYADNKGNIYYLYNGLIPVRNENYHWSQYLRGDTSATLWTKFLPFDQLPQVLNPASGFARTNLTWPTRKIPTSRRVATCCCAPNCRMIRICELL